jgi:hypothetical protein
VLQALGHILEQSSGALVPARRHRVLELVPVLARELESCEGGARPVVFLEVARVGALERFDRGREAARPHGGVAEEL